ncbi:B12-binding domain-containing radical SAM protein [Magnetospirillum gryphiswaldense]|nr:radical SAM protein [Magnetospirillum gryphiswaldense]
MNAVVARPLRIVLSSMKHTTSGRHSSFMPVAIGFIASYLLSKLGDRVKVTLHEDPDELLTVIRNESVDVLALSHYCWNAELNYLTMRHAKRINPNIICVTGGPEFPIPEDFESCREFLLKHASIDIHVYGEGEVPFAALMERLAEGVSLEHLMSNPQLGSMSIHPQSGELVHGPRPDRLMDMDVIPSPYLMGLMDHFFDGEHAPMVQLARGCPYQCAFCDASQSWYSKVGRFSMGRVREELHLIAEKVKDHPHLVLAITDSNFGQYKEDVEVATILRELREIYHWPNAFDVTSGKSQHERILSVSDMLDNKFQLYSSTQSFNQETLEIIKRKNLGGEKWHEVLGEVKKRRMETAADYIIPMPKETKQSFLDGMKIYLEAGVDLIVPLTLVMLKGTPLASKEQRSLYEMQTKWRLVSRSIGTYAGERCFEVEEVCIATSTFSFQDYLDCRGFSYATILFRDPQYDVIEKHVRELGLSPFEFIMRAWELIRDGKSPISDIYDEFIRQTRIELFDAPELIKEFFDTEESYAKLLTGELGDNLLRRFRAMVVIDRAKEALMFAYDCLFDVAGDRLTDAQRAGLEASRRWASLVRDVGPVFAGQNFEGVERLLHSDYDIQAWYQDRSDKTLEDFCYQTTYRLWFDGQKIGDMLGTGERMYGKDKYLSIPRLLLYYDARHFWFRCDSVEREGAVGARPDRAGLDWKLQNWLS